MWKGAGGGNECVAWLNGCMFKLLSFPALIEKLSMIKTTSEIDN